MAFKENKTRNEKEGGAGPFRKYSFYLDLKDYANIHSITNDIVGLGGTVETFLSKEVKYVVTNQPRHAGEQQQPPAGSCNSSLSVSRQSSRSFSPACISAFQDSSSNQEALGIRINCVKSRAETLLETARRQNAAKGSCDVLSVARMWGIKVIHVSTLSGRIKKLQSTSSVNRDALKHEGVTGRCQRVRLFVPFIKYEDNSKLFAPQYRQLQSWPVVNLDSAPGSCPFAVGGGVCNNKQSAKKGKVLQDLDCSSLKENKPPNAKVGAKRKEVPPGPGKKPGYCEMCCVHYDDLHLHVETKSHLDYVRDGSNFLMLDRKISTLPTLKQLADVVSQDRVESSGPPGDSPRHRKRNLEDTVGTPKRKALEGSGGFALPHSKHNAPETNSLKGSSAQVIRAPLMDLGQNRATTTEPSQVCRASLGDNSVLQGSSPAATRLLRSTAKRRSSSSPKEATGNCSSSQIFAPKSRRSLQLPKTSSSSSPVAVPWDPVEKKTEQVEVGQCDEHVALNASTNFSPPELVATGSSVVCLNWTVQSEPLDLTGGSVERGCCLHAGGLPPSCFDYVVGSKCGGTEDARCDNALEDPPPLNKLKLKRIFRDKQNLWIVT